MLILVGTIESVSFKGFICSVIHNSKAHTHGEHNQNSTNIASINTSHQISQTQQLIVDISMIVASHLSRHENEQIARWMRHMHLNNLQQMQSRWTEQWALDVANTIVVIKKNVWKTPIHSAYAVRRTRFRREKLTSIHTLIEWLKFNKVFIPNKIDLIYSQLNLRILPVWQRQRDSLHMAFCWT